MIKFKKPLIHLLTSILILSSIAVFLTWFFNLNGYDTGEESKVELRWTRLENGSYIDDYFEESMFDLQVFHCNTELGKKLRVYLNEDAKVWTLVYTNDKDPNVAYAAWEDDVIIEEEDSDGDIFLKSLRLQYHPYVFDLVVKNGAGADIGASLLIRGLSDERISDRCASDIYNALLRN